MTALLPAARAWRSALVGLVLAAGLAACDDSIDTPDSLRGTYTLWGALDPTSDVQSIRVVPVTDTIGTTSAAPLPVTVTSTDLQTGAEAAWRDSVVTFSDGSVGHIYRSTFRPAYGSRHRFVVRRPDGSDISALITVPPFVEPVYQTPLLVGGVRYPVLWPGAPQLNRVLVTYTVQETSCALAEVTRELVGTSGPVEFGWQTVIHLAEDDDTIQRIAGGPRGLRRIRITAEVASEDWRPPGGVFDPDVLAEPGSLGNVRGGFGFVGAAYNTLADFVPRLTDLSSTSFLNTAGSCP